ncbi:alpha/beta-hydrolase [Rhizodiscina lignyota]|uniref:Alpha/beta-hydrolase n=1 Tax=Rhizodiscina lignyota TaxID=1504668 RepID=A0A9P4ILV5_9PEZI|nr:alpha/beta-hydrolase [Rhizodiscina lignyota]
MFDTPISPFLKVQSENYTYKTFDSKRPILATAHYTNSFDEPKPIVLSIHGGGYSTGARSEKPTPQIEHLCRNNIVVVSIDHRLFPNVSLADGPVADTRDAYHWCRTELPKLMWDDFDIEVDGNRIAVMGYSSGAHMAMLLGLETPKPKAVLDFYGTMYLSDEWWTKSVDLPVPDFDKKFIEKVFSEPVVTSVTQLPADRAKDENTGMDARTAWLMTRMKTGTLVEAITGGDFDKFDPPTRFSSEFPPTFFAHGEKDNLVSVEISKKAYAQLKELGVDTDMVIVGGKGHGYDATIDEMDDHWEDYVQKGLDFLIEHV